jgi:hypothetical protein
VWHDFLPYLNTNLSLSNNLSVTKTSNEDNGGDGVDAGSEIRH